MEILFSLWEALKAYLPSTLTIVGVVLALVLVQRILERRRKGASERSFRHQLIMLGLTFLALLIVVLVLPVPAALQGQLLGLIGILLSVAVALSSTTFLGNAMAGVMLRVVKNFRMGDFIRTEEHFGRVSERGLFHTEIQTEDRELTTLPNLYLVTHPVTTLRTSGTIVAATVSLGYDVPRERIEKRLLEAAAEVGLSDPFVQIKELGDFSVTYRIAGLLTEVKQILTVRSKLRGCVMDALHAGGVEIVSPNFMNTRSIAEGRAFVPRRSVATPEAAKAEAASKPEDVVFDKAEEAESLESLKESHRKLIEEIGELEGKIKEAEDDEAKVALEATLGRLSNRKEFLERIIASREESAKEG
jgi:small-conductance mechanosensitive channel